MNNKKINNFISLLLSPYAGVAHVVVQGLQKLPRCARHLAAFSGPQTRGIGEINWQFTTEDARVKLGISTISSLLLLKESGNARE